MKQKIIRFLIHLLIKIMGKYPCIIFNRINTYTKRVDAQSKLCPFCTLEWEKILYTSKHRFVIPNKYPYYWTEDHILLVPHSHIGRYEELSDEEFMELKKLYTKYFSEWYILLGREFGKTKWASVHHLHIHFIKNK